MTPKLRACRKREQAFVHGSVAIPDQLAACALEPATILHAIAAKLKRRSNTNSKGRHYEVTLVVQAVCWSLRYPLATATSRSCSWRVA